MSGVKTFAELMHKFENNYLGFFLEPVSSPLSWKEDGWCEGSGIEGLYHYGREYGWLHLLCQPIPVGREISEGETAF